MTPSPQVLETFGVALEAVGIRGQKLDVIDSRGIIHSRGPSTWQQRRYKIQQGLSRAHKSGNQSNIEMWKIERDAHEHMPFNFEFQPVAEAGSAQMQAVTSAPLAPVADSGGRYMF